MTKIICFPLIKLLLFMTGFLGVASILRASSVTFEAVFVATADRLNDFMRFGFVPGIAVTAISVSLLLFAVWKTTPRVRMETIFRLWRNFDGILLLLFASYISLYLLSAAYNNWTAMGVIALPVLAYTAIILAVAEIVARLRDKDFSRTFYWFSFFRTHPIWKPLGFLFAMLLAGNVFLFVIFTQDLGEMLGFRGYSVTTLVRVTLVHGRLWERARVDIGTAQLIFSGISLIALTYFVVILQGVEARFARANAEQVRAERFKSELITNVSHDIKTPLTSIINYVDLLKTQPLADSAKEYVAVLDKKSDRLKTLIDDLMDASKAGTGNIQVELQEINLAELVGQIAGEFDEKYIEQNLTLVLRGTDEPVFIQGDNRHLWRVLENLFSNTVKYALSGTRIFAELTQNRNAVVLTLKNTSATPIDLPSDSLAEQFIRGDRARESEGSGLGLYIAKSLVELMGYTFDIRTSGDLFEVEIVFCGWELRNARVENG